ncbi:MAG: ribulose-phosphate 3-epimerase [Chloroflexi bacterium]|nr:ribulose-phosphate 3-epimerase [Chloroflexota bacterium]
MKLAPSVLSADFSCLAEQLDEVTKAGADYIHIDVMDGHFVPNITIGPLVVEAINRSTGLPLDVHLMIEDPEKYIGRFVEAGADIITVHVEACTHLHRVVENIKELKVKAGVSLNPGTSLEAIYEILPDINLLLIMSVNPGFGGQKFIHGMIDKIARARERIDKAQLACEIEIDGGITADNAAEVVKAGAQILVAGSAIFNNKIKITEAVNRLRSSLP